MKNKQFFIAFVVLSAFFSPLLVQAVTVGPVKLEYSVDPGDVISGEIFLFNETEEIKTFYPTFEKYIEVDGKKKFITGESLIADWFEISPSRPLDTNEQMHIPFTLRIPENADPGGHFAVLWWGSTPPAKEGEQQVSIVTRAGILIYLRVSGEIDETGQLVSFSTENQERFLGHLPVSFDVVFEATGNVHLKPKGEIQIKNIFGRTKAILEINKNESQVFPKSKKTFNAVWSSPKRGVNKGGIFGGLISEWQNFALGLYKAKITLEYGEEVKEIKDSFMFFVFPWRILCLIILALFVFVLGFLRLLKKYNQWIISKSKR